MIRALLLTCSLLLSLPAAAAGADEAYREAKEAYQKLKKDEKRRALRHHWQAVARKFETISSKYPKSDRAPEALFTGGELSNELSRISRRDDDRDAAKRSYRKLIDGWPRHRLADDAALSLARLLADREGDVAGARRVLEGSLKTANDMRKDMQAMLAALPRPAASPPPPPPRPVAVAKREAGPAVARPVESAPAKEPEAPTSEGAKAVADAIRRAVQPAEETDDAPAEAPPEAPVAQARRVAPLRPAAEALEPEGEEAAEAEAVVERAEPALASLTEKLRDVRVGAAVPGADDTATRSRFKALAQGEAEAELSLAQQLGLKVRRVVIDAGHGGHDTGAIGAKGTKEKDVSLAISKKLAARLEAMGLEVVLTRDDDTYVKLEDRTRIANRQRGDLFISVHCNASPSRKLRGIETYTLNTSSNRYSIRLAARENATTERGVGDLQYILADLATKANTGESTHLAERVQRSLVRSLSGTYKDVKNLGTKEALFFVLLGAKMPAILVETSFLSHPEEELRLADSGYQQKVADSIAEAVSGFLEERNRVAQLD